MFFAFFLLFQHHFQKVLVDVLKFDMLQFETGLDRIVKTFSYDVTILLIGFEGLDVDVSFFIADGQAVCEEVIVQYAVGPHIAFVELYHF